MKTLLLLDELQRAGSDGTRRRQMGRVERWQTVQ